MDNITNINILKLTVKNINVQCYTAGETGSPVILLHGGGVDSANISWREVIEPFSKNHQVFAPDLPGYGTSERPDIDYSLSFYIDFVKELMSELNLNSASLIGLSLGGGISLGFTLEYPSKVENLVLVDSWGIFSKLPFHQLSYWYTKSFLNELSYALSAKSRSFVKWTILNSLIGDSSKVSEELVNQIHEILKAPNAGKAFISFQRSEINRKGLNTNLSARYSEIKIPTLIIHGSHDTTVPVKYAKEAHASIRDSQLYIMEGCKHWPQKERPEEFTKVVKAFLTS
ncbi:putative hydrolase [Bacillus sp. TS-2]|nr:putative hydrolase [Bacillus sp. TS-2]